MFPIPSLDDALKMLGKLTCDLQMAAQKIATLQETIQRTEAEVVRLRALVPPTPAPEG